MRDPYAIYARHVLKLRALDPLDADPGAADRGTYHPRCARPLPPRLSGRAAGRCAGAPRRVRTRGVRRRARSSVRARLLVAAFPAHRRMVRDRGARAPLAHRRKRRRMPRASRPARGTRAVRAHRPRRPDRPAQGWRARHHRLQDWHAAAGLGYRAGLCAAASARGGDRRSGRVRARAAGRGEGARVLAAHRPRSRRQRSRPSADLRERVAEALDGLARLIARFDDERTPYRSQPRPERAPRYSDYTHLARVKEWSAGGGGE